MNLFEFLAWFAIVGGLVFGFMYGLEEGGVWEAVTGALKSAGMAYLGWVVFMLGILALLWLMLRYRPYYPRCRTGRCRDHHYQVLAVDVAQEPQLLREGQAKPGSLVRCRCGTRYLLANFEHRFYEVTEDGVLVPYLRYRPYRRWEPDPG